MKIDRLIGILSILLQTEKVTAPYLAEKFEVSRRTIIRDIDALCQAGIPIATMQGADGGISIMEGYKIDNTLLTSTDMQAILAGLRSLDSISGTNQYQQLMEKLLAGSSDFMTGNQTILIDLSSWTKDALNEKISLIQQCIKENRQIKFVYFSPKEEIERTIEPYYLIFHWSSWYVWGWCTLRQSLRMFKLSRMEQLQECGTFEKRQIPMPDFSSDKIFDYHIPVKALIDSKFKWRLIDEFGSGCFQELPDGKLLFSAPFCDERTILSWILSFQDGIELLEPENLRTQLFSFGETLIKKYK